MKNKTTQPLTRADLVLEIRERLSLSGREATVILEELLECIAETLEQDSPVTLSGIGRFQVKHTPARPGRNPKTGSPALVPAKYRPTFTMSRTLRTKMMSALDSGTFRPEGEADH